MEWPQVVIIILWALRIVIGATLHGQEIKYTKNVLVEMVSVGVSFWILYSGGFFN